MNEYEELFDVLNELEAKLQDARGMVETVASIIEIKQTKRVEIIKEWYRCYTDGKNVCAVSAALDLLYRLDRGGRKEK